MAITPKQIGQSAEANLLWNISKQLDNLKKTSSIADPALLAKIDDLITVSSEIELSAENINLNTDDLEALISEGNALLEEIRDNTTSLLTNHALETGGNLEALNVREQDIDSNGSATSATPLIINVEEKGTLSFTVSGTWAGAIIVEGSLDGINWFTTTFTSDASGNSTSTISGNTSGQINTVGFDFIRFRSNTITSGTANFVVMTSRLVSNVMLDNPLPTGGNMIGKVKIVNEEFYTEDVEEDTSNNTTFVGKQTTAGVWLLQKIVEATVGTKTTTTMEYASVLNNATKTTYVSAWTDRATLTYSEIKNLL